MISNLTKNSVVARRPFYARSLLDRGRGMIGRDFTNFDAMVFEHCNTIHTFFMVIPLDILFIDQENKVVDLRKGLRPWIPLVRCGSAVSLLELPAGNIEISRTEIGDSLDLNAEVTLEVKNKLINKELLETPAATAAIPFKGRST